MAFSTVLVMVALSLMTGHLQLVVMQGVECDELSAQLQMIETPCRNGPLSCVSVVDFELLDPLLCTPGEEMQERYDDVVRCEGQRVADEAWGGTCGGPLGSLGRRCYSLVDQTIDELATSAIAACCPMNSTVGSCSGECATQLTTLRNLLGCCTQTFLYTVYFQTCGAGTTLQSLYEFCEVNLEDPCRHLYSGEPDPCSEEGVIVWVGENLDTECQFSLGIVRTIQEEARSTAMSESPLIITDEQRNALESACTEECIGRVIGYLEDSCNTITEASGIASVCTRNANNGLCLSLSGDIAVQVSDINRACATSDMSCRDSCSALLPQLYSTAGCCVKTPLPLSPFFNSTIDLLRGYFTVCEQSVDNQNECEVPFINDAATVMVWTGAVSLFSLLTCFL